MSVPSSDWPHQGESLTPPEPGPPANSDSDPGHLPDKHPEETSAQDPEVLSLGLPCLDTDGASTLPGLRILLQQLPPQDSDERYCLAFEEDELAELRLFCAQRRREALGQGVACLVLSKLVEHTCEKACGQALIDLIYFYHDGHLYCGRHHAELLRPRCPACDQLIFSRRCTEAEGRRWHENHFCCQDCAGPLGGGRYAVPGAAPAAPAALSVAIRLPARARPRHWKGGRPLQQGEAGPDRAEDAAAVPEQPFPPLPPAAARRPREGRFHPARSRKIELGAGRRHPKGRNGAGWRSRSTPGRTPPCPTCSSSSDSEPEGFFLGQRLPGPWKSPGSLQAGDSDTSRRHCAIC